MDALIVSALNDAANQPANIAVPMTVDGGIATAHSLIPLSVTNLTRETTQDKSPR